MYNKSPSRVNGGNKMNPTTYIAAVVLHASVSVVCAQTYRISTIAGGGLPLRPMPALEVSIGHATGVATDRAGNVYFSSTLNCVFKLDPNGFLTRIAGTYQAGFSGDGGPATAAQLYLPRGLAVDSAGSIYIADDYGGRVRKVSRDGTITTIAGNGTSATSGDGGAATNASLNHPQAVAVDLAGRVYIAEYGGLRSVSLGGTITTIASALSVKGIAVDSAGTLYIAVDSQVFKVASDGRMITVAGKGNIFGSSGDGGPAVDATLGLIFGLTVDSAGNLIIADGTLRSISPDGIIHTIVGAICCDAPNVNQAWQGSGVAVDVSGNVYVSILLGDLIRKITPKGVVTTVAGTDHPTYVGDGGPATEAQLFNPEGVAVDALGNVFIADYGNSRVRKVSPGGTITTVAGTGASGFSGDGGPATKAQLGGPVGIAIDSAGNLFISEYLNSRVRRVAPDGTISTVAGSDLCCDLGDGGAATNALVPQPHGIALDSFGNLYIAEWPDSRLRRVTPDGIITTVAGNGTRGLSGDGGPATAAQLNLPWGVAVGANGNIYIADNQNLRIRKISPDGIIMTIAGGSGSAGNLGNPVGVAVDAAGNLFVADGAAMWRISLDGTVSEPTAHLGGQQVLVEGTDLALDSQRNIYLVSGNRILKLEPMVRVNRHR
jgi:sugar lactone lactonase YvrE